MKYEVRDKNRVIGTTKLEGGDPPMGFVFGSFYPTENYNKGLNQESLLLTIKESFIQTNSIVIEDFSEQMGEICLEITVLVESAEEYEKYFKHHIDAYMNLFN